MIQSLTFEAREISCDRQSRMSISGRPARLVEEAERLLGPETKIARSS